MIQPDQKKPELELPQHIEQFYRDKAQQEGRAFAEEIAIALQEHMDMVQQQAHQPVPGQNAVKGESQNDIDTPDVPY